VYVTAYPVSRGEYNGDFLTKENRMLKWSARIIVGIGAALFLLLLGAVTYMTHGIFLIMIVFIIAFFDWFT